MALKNHSFPPLRILASMLIAGTLFATQGCMRRTPDLGLAPVTPPIAIQSPVSGDTIYPGPHIIQYSMDNIANALWFELYVNDTLSATIPADTANKKPTILWDVDTLLLNRRVSYFISAYDLDGNRANSPVMSNILVAISPTPPLPPDNLTITLFGESSVNLTWENRSFNETSVEVWKRISDGPYALIQSLPPNSVSTNDTGIVAGVSYHYRVRAVNSYGYADSKEVGIGNDLPVMNPPTNLTATPLGTKMVLLQWDDNSNGELAFVIERRITSGIIYTQVGLAGPNETSFLDTTGLVASGSYTYRVAARGQFEQSDWSNEASVITLYIDTYPPSNLSATIDSSGRKVILTWKSNTIYDAETHIERRPDPGGSFADIGKVGTSVTTYTDTTVTPPSAYSYRVRVLSVDKHYTPYSNVVSVVLPSPGASAATLSRHDRATR